MKLSTYLFATFLTCALTLNNPALTPSNLNANFKPDPDPDLDLDPNPDPDLNPDLNPDPDANRLALRCGTLTLTLTWLVFS